MLAELGAIIIDADQAAREVVRPGTYSWSQLRDLLGAAYFNAANELDRRKLRQRIISDEPCRLQVNAILHPAIMAFMNEQFQQRHQLHPENPAIFDIPLVFEAGLAQHFDIIILVFIPKDLQIQRLMERDGVAREEAEQSLAMQLSLEQKKAWAHKIVDNSGDLENTRRQVVAIWRELVEEHRSEGS
jgi:dephospho-CoA kinase